MLCVVLAGCCCLLRRALWRCPLPWGPVLFGAAFCGVPPCCVCFVVARGCVLLLAALLCAVWLVAKLSRELWDECRSTAERKARSLRYEDLCVLLLELALEKESDQHLNNYRPGG